jgi:acetoacetate decarboxylase
MVKILYHGNHTVKPVILWKWHYCYPKLRVPKFQMEADTLCGLGIGAVRVRTQLLGAV